MKSILRLSLGTATVLALSVALLVPSRPAFGQQAPTPAINLSVQDASVVSTLKSLFQQAGIKNYIIEGGVAGFVTLNLSEQPFETALKLVLRANSIPLTYSRENEVWTIKLRRVVSVESAIPAPAVEPSATLATTRFDKIELMHIDPLDLARILGGVTIIPHFTRQRGGQGFPSGRVLLNPFGQNAQGQGGLLIGSGSNPIQQNAILPGSGFIGR